MRIRLVFAVALAAALVVALAAPASACGGLVGENGTIQLQRTTTLAGYHDGLEHYVTSFEFTGEGDEVGSIIPLPGVPTVVERGGDWTLQRLEREVTPVDRFALEDAAVSAPQAASATVILQTKIDALDITILQGGGTEVGKWAIDHGFLLTPDAPEILDYYSQRSPIFMAARFDAATAKALGQNAGDGTPIALTIPTSHPWVPLRILSLGLQPEQTVQADVFLLTDDKPQLLIGGTGIDLERSEPASQSLLSDLRSDKNTQWVPDSEWFSYLKVDAHARELDYDLATSVDHKTPPSLVDAGLTTSDVAAYAVDLTATARASQGIDWSTWGWPVAFVLVAVATVGLVTVSRRRRRAGSGAAAR
jgi:hypothetical protein